MYIYTCFDLVARRKGRVGAGRVGRGGERERGKAGRDAPVPEDLRPASPAHIDGQVGEPW